MKRWLWWASWFPSALGIFIILTSARWKLTRSPFYVAEWTRIGYSDSALLGIGILQVTCLVLYLIPRTAVLGMVLFTGYLGGAIASYVRMREPSPVLVPLTTCCSSGWDSTCERNTFARCFRSAGRLGRRRHLPKGELFSEAISGIRSPPREVGNVFWEWIPTCKDA